MSEPVIAICNPELHGDLLWSVPAMRAMAHRDGGKADIWISRRGHRTRDLLQAQSFVRNVIVDETYDPGTSSPFHRIPAPEDPSWGYAACYQLGFRIPERSDCTLLDYFGRLGGVGRQAHYFDLPADCPREPLPEGPFVALDAKGYDGSRWRDCFRDFVRHCPLPVVEIGVPGYQVTTDCGALDRLRWGFLEMAGIISKCKYYVGTLTASLVIADAMPNVVRIAVQDGKSWNMHHATASPMNHYPITYDYLHLLSFIQ